MPLTRQQRRATERRQKEGKPEPDRRQYIPHGTVAPDTVITPDTAESRRKAQQAIAMLRALAIGGQR